MEPVRWSPPTATPRAGTRQSSPPMPAVRRVELPGAGPEDVVFGADGLVYTGIDDGRILRVDLLSGAVETVLNTGGRPLGLCAGSDGSLLICDAHRGLLRWPGTGTEADVLVDAIEGVPLNMASNVVRDPGDGTVYFTASSRRWPLDQWMGDLDESALAVTHVPA
ncbi:SMP-30/gluconolactonase/LRE family protein [Nocardia sp. NPDC057663]|uniref:SMP-30/gluconolactonase/LRE family protein n=1 Tax=Nocardia sp. NPDC057663 TaxID=3346201 RepID=UPI00366EF595